MTEARVAFTGFMGVGKSSVARHLASILKCEQVDLDSVIEKSESRSIVEIITNDGEAAYRKIETRNLEGILLKSPARIISLGGGAWTVPVNREMIVSNGVVTVWLESTFDHCWTNISKSRKERPLAKNKDAARRLFEERQAVYCLADWHFIIRPEFNSYDIAKQIAEQVFS